MTLGNKTKTIESPLATARGMGATHHGMEHWLLQRVTAVSNFALMIWLVWSVTQMGVIDHASFTAWLAQPVNAVLMIFAIISTFVHATLGLQVVYEDYIQCTGFRLMKIIGTKLFFGAAAIACIFSILKIAFIA